jgi:hypothetical protein
MCTRSPSVFTTCEAKQIRVQITFGVIARLSFVELAPVKVVQSVVLVCLATIHPVASPTEMSRSG